MGPRGQSRVTGRHSLDTLAERARARLVEPAPSAVSCLSSYKHALAAPVSQGARAAVCASIVVLGLAWPIPTRAQVVSPGDLARPHAHLEGAQKCTECHANRGRVEPDRCLACHQVLGDRMRDKRGYHALLGNTRCGKCHQDHQGRGFDIIRWPGRGEAAFDHRRAGYVLRGEHTRPRCRECHKPANQVDARVKRFASKRRETTYLGLSTQCRTCHDDAHEGRLGDACDSCHGYQTFERAPDFDHDDARFKLAGAHHRVPCDECHRDASRQPPVVYRGIEYATCAACHQDPHRGAMRVAGKPLSDACSDCHTEQSWQRLLYRRADHSPRQMPLFGAHARTSCTGCHGAKAAKMPSAACASCHEDVHKGRFGADCGQCHEPIDWRARSLPRPGVPEQRIAGSARLGLTRNQLARVEFHQRTRFPLTGLHVRVACARCHPRSRKGFKRRFQNIRHGACSDCHDDPHQAQFQDARCDGCHTTDGWHLTTYDVARHRSARFALDNSHRGVACVRCHPASRPAASRFRTGDRSCQGCHDDQHDGQFASAVDAKRPARTCDECHDTRAFKPIASFDHDDTRMPLRDAHGETACASCHRPARAGDDTSGVVYRGVSPACADCHRDRHKGQFRMAPGHVRRCQQCHTQKRFTIPAFDHYTQTNYPLEGAHQKVECQDCHHQVELGDGGRVVLYRLGERACSECHAEEHGHGARRLRARHSPNVVARIKGAQTGANSTQLDRCEVCHTTSDWRALTLDSRELTSGGSNGASGASFDHASVGYRLRGLHADVACGLCHTGAGSRTLTRECAGCHDDRHQGRLGSACAECHQPESWRITEIRDQHGQTRLPLTGKHALADCTSCHPRASAAEYTPVPAACVGCHIDAYNDPITHPDHARTGFGIECQDCHRPAGWSPAYYAHTQFPLLGAHRRTSCGSCHTQAQVPNECATCHQDDVARATVPDHAIAGFPSDCAICHSQNAWQPVPYPAHEQRFPIRSGPHKGFACNDCHDSPSDIREYTCLTPCHTRAETDREHGGIMGYMYESMACLECHPRGRE